MGCTTDVPSTVGSVVFRRPESPASDNEGLKHREVFSNKTLPEVSSPAARSGPPRRSRSGTGDAAGGSSSISRISLNMPGRLPKVCMVIPGFCVFGMVTGLVAIAIIHQPWFYAVAAVLTLYMFAWTVNFAVSSAVGAWRMRAGCAEDWHGKLENLRKQRDYHGSETAHIVILPNYKEDEEILWETLENLGRSPEARNTMRVVLAMEEREGSVPVREKADRLRNRAKGLFQDIIAVYHPAGLLQELAGKSSNTQWAFREAMRHFAGELSKLDPSKVFLTVGDADTLWHPQYFSALAYQGLSMPAEQRQWAIWQPPILLLKNLFSVPGMTRCSAYGTILFEISGLVHQYLGKHLCFSAYSLTLALASHYAVNGWDTDVIAEDHHMFAKCFFASLWEAKDACVDMMPKVQLCPVWLPAVSTLPEEDGWLASNKARFQQAKRHSMGIAELSYVLLQYARLMLDVGFWRLPFRTHVSINSLILKMYTVHITSNVQAFALITSAAFALPSLISWMYAGGLSELINTILAHGLSVFLQGESFSMVKWAFIGMFGPCPAIGLLVSFTTYTVVNDLLDGRYSYAASKSEKMCTSQGIEMPTQASKQLSRRGWLERFWLALKIQNDYFNLAEITIVCHGLIPALMASWSLMRRGQAKFEYVVASKPTAKVA